MTPEIKEAIETLYKVILSANCHCHIGGVFCPKCEGGKSLSLLVSILTVRGSDPAPQDPKTPTIETIVKELYIIRAYKQADRGVD